MSNFYHFMVIFCRFKGFLLKDKFNLFSFIMAIIMFLTILIGFYSVMNMMFYAAVRQKSFDDSLKVIRQQYLEDSLKYEVAKKQYLNDSINTRKQFINDSIKNCKETIRLKCEFYLDHDLGRLRYVRNDELYEKSFQYSIDSARFFSNQCCDSIDSSYYFDRETGNFTKVNRFSFSLNRDIEKGCLGKQMTEKKNQDQNRIVNGTVVNGVIANGVVDKHPTNDVGAFAGSLGLMLGLCLLDIETLPVLLLVR